MARSKRPDVAASSARLAVGQAIRRAMEQSDLRNQEALADALGIDQTAVSRMITGKTSVTVERVAEIERACGLPLGQILRWAGYVDDGTALPAAAQGAAGSRQRVGRRANRPRPAPEPDGA
jgi:transcriptional regulator with XRE-family HTH domain